MHDRLLRVPAAGHQAEDAIALGEVDHVAAQRLDLAGDLEARDGSRRSRRKRVATEAQENVGAVHPRGADVDADLTTRRLRRRHVAKLEDLGTARFADHDRAHENEV